MNLVTKGQAKVGKLVVTLGAMDMSKQATAQLIGGSTSFSIRNNANNADNIITTDAGAVTVRAGLTVTAGGATITAGNLTVSSGNLAVTGTGTITSAGASALAVGAGGATNPALNVDASTASSVTGLNIKSAASGGGLAVSVISSAGAEKLTIDAKGTGVIVIGGTSTGQISIGRGFIGTTIFSSSIGALGTVQSSTPTAAQLLGGIVTQTGQTGAGTVTLPTGTQLSTAVTGVAVGDTFECLFMNLGGGFTLTITGASGSTVIGTAAVPSGKSVYMIFVNTGANAWNVYCTVSA